MITKYNSNRQPARRPCSLKNILLSLCGELLEVSRDG
jgi:hypothetical protein